MKFNWAFVKSLCGAFSGLAFVLLIVSLGTMEGGRSWILPRGPKSQALLFHEGTLVVSCVMLAFFLVIAVLSVHQDVFLSGLNLKYTMLANSAFWTILLIASCSVFLAEQQENVNVRHRLGILCRTRLPKEPDVHGCKVTYPAKNMETDLFLTSIACGILAAMCFATVTVICLLDVTGSFIVAGFE